MSHHDTQDSPRGSLEYTDDFEASRSLLPSITENNAASTASLPPHAIPLAGNKHTSTSLLTTHILSIQKSTPLTLLPLPLILPPTGEEAVLNSTVERGGGGGVVKIKVMSQEEKDAYKERKLKAKKKREAKQQAEIQKIVEEKKEEVDELLQVASDGQSQLERLEAKYARMKRRYERKVKALEVELEDLREV